MGQTLSHGVYLPNEGERNCYAGLASNWQILNTAVGAIAEKAPLVHTHGNITNDGKVGTDANKPLITGTGGVVQAGSFGTTSGTFCEGNDSRLSDARTPVAHTHGKADITDLFNSANTWTGDNTFKGNIYQNQGDANYIIPRGTNTVKGDLTTSGSFSLMFKDKNNGNLATSGIGYFTLGQNSSGSYANIGVETVGSTDNTRHSNSISFRIDPTTNDNTAQFYPVNNYATDLGDSTHQWNNLYAKNYYYNGTEFQSKFVTTDTVQTVNGVKTFTAYVESIGSSTGDEYSSNTRTNLWLMGNRDTKEVSGVLFDTYRQNTAQGTGMHILGIGIKENRVRYEGCRWGWYWDNNLNGYTFDFKPTTQGANQALKHNLGTSVDKWNTLNGINPGALSLPDNSGYTNISGNITDLTGAVNSYTPPSDGYVMVNVNPDSNNYAYVSLERVTVRSSSETTSGKNAMAAIPVIGGKSIDISVIGASIAQARFTPCQGNV